MTVRAPTLTVLGRGRRAAVLAAAATAALTTSLLAAAAGPAPAQGTSGYGDGTGQQLIDQGRQTFRFDTFGDQAFWGDTLHLHQAIAGAANGGVGPGVSPKTALSVGLKVDSTALPAAVKQGIANGTVNLDDPAVTVTLLKLNSVVGVKGFF